MLPGEAAHGSSSSRLVTTRIDHVAGINYSLVAPPTATTDNLDGQLKVRRTLGNLYPHAFATGPPGAPQHPNLGIFSLLWSHWLASCYS